MTGHVPDQLDEWIRQLPVELEDIYLAGQEEGELRKIGQGFEVNKVMTCQDELGEFEWKERWLVIHSDRHAKKQQTGFLKRLEQAEKAVKSSLPKATESVTQWETRLNKILEEQGVSEFLTVRTQETTRTKKHYLRPGQPTANTLYRWETESELSCRIDRQAAVIEAHQQRMGWRIYVTNADSSQMTLQQSVKPTFRTKFFKKISEDDKHSPQIEEVLGLKNRQVIELKKSLFFILDDRCFSQQDQCTFMTFGVRNVGLWIPTGLFDSTETH